MSLDQEPRSNGTESSGKKSRETVILLRLPFTDGSTPAPGWRARNDGSIITLAQRSIRDGDPLRFGENISSMANRYPVLGKMFTRTTPHYAQTRPYEVCTLPTVATANAFAEEVLAPLPTAGIELLQTHDKKRTPGVRYVEHLVEGGLVVGATEELFMHDLMAHWIGAVTTWGPEFEVFKTLYGERRSVQRKHGAVAEKSYVEALGRAFDLNSALSYIDVRLQVMNGTLPKECLSIIKMQCPDLLDQSAAIVQETDLDPEERANYYANVTNTLTQDPWEPPNYVAPQPR